MHVQPAIRAIFEQLQASLIQLDDEQYRYSGETLSHSSIGQHVRHIIDMFVCLEDGYENGIVNYEHRKRDPQTEAQKSFAIRQLGDILAGIEKSNKPLQLEVAYPGDGHTPFFVDTNYERELVYNLEHTIHHMALIKVGIREVSSIELPAAFGVASSTLKFRSSCAQ